MDRTSDIPLRSQEDVVSIRRLVRSHAIEIGLSLVDQTKLVTAASEIARNTVIYGGGGQMRLEMVSDGTRRGLRLSFEDQGPGIADIERAMQDGYTSGGGLGLGLGGAKRLTSEFSITSNVGAGTRVVLTQWNRLR